MKMPLLQLVLFMLATACIHVQAQSICNVTIYDVVRDLSTELTKDVTSAVDELKEMLKIQEEMLKKQEEMLKKQEEKLEDLASDMKACCKGTSDKPHDCATLYREGVHSSGVYTIYPSGGLGIRVYCDMETDGGGWMVFQKRYNGALDFFRGWDEYAAGFGDTEGDYWLGLQNIHLLTKTPTKLYVGLTDFDLGSRYAKYGIFSVANEIDKFRLTVGRYSGNAGDSLKYHNGHKFSTRDEDNDDLSEDCSNKHHGAWWYRGSMWTNCHRANLNGRFSATKVIDSSYMTWYYLHNSRQSMKGSVMMMRPANF